MRLFSLHLELCIFQYCFILTLVAMEHTRLCAFGTIHLSNRCIISCSGSTIVGIGSPDPPAFVYDDEDYKDVFVSGMAPLFYCTSFSFLCKVWCRHSEGLISLCAEACLLTRDENEWYREPISANATSGKEGLQVSVAD